MDYVKRNRGPETFQKFVYCAAVLACASAGAVPDAKWGLRRRVPHKAVRRQGVPTFGIRIGK
jgi:hypothetical protein